MGLSLWKKSAPPGGGEYTSRLDVDTGELICDLTADGQRQMVAEGGRGGLGNTRFKSSVNQTPRRCTPGSPGERRSLRLELKVLADVGLLGLPNAGKSTLLAAVSRARPKIGDYPFTTLHPNLGVAYVDDGELVIFLHGFPTTPFAFRPQLQALAAAGYQPEPVGC